MKLKQIPSPHHFVKILCQGEKIQPEGALWRAFDALKKCNEAKARGIFEAEYIIPPDTPEESARASIIFALASGIPPYTRDFGWVELFAAAGLTDAISDMVAAERVSPIHALHAEIELGPRFFPNPTLAVTTREAECLLSLYEIEAEVLMASRMASYHVDKWLNDRNRRAADYVMMLISSDNNCYSHCMVSAAF